MLEREEEGSVGIELEENGMEELSFYLLWQKVNI